MLPGGDVAKRAAAVAQQHAHLRGIPAGARHFAGHAAQHIPLHGLHLGLVGEEGAAQLEKDQLANAVVHGATSCRISSAPSSSTTQSPSLIRAMAT